MGILMRASGRLDGSLKLHPLELEVKIQLINIGFSP